MTADILEVSLDVLKTSWNENNTDSCTPRFLKITDEKRLDFRRNADNILATRSNINNEAAGVGNVPKHELESFNFDVRILGFDKEAHFYRVVSEVKRIIRNNKINPFTAVPSTHTFEYEGNEIDLSDKGRGIWRRLIPSQVNKYVVER